MRVLRGGPLHIKKHGKGEERTGRTGELVLQRNDRPDAVNGI